MWLHLYTLLYLLVLPGALIRHWWRGRREPGYRREPLARFGRAPELAPGAIWIHAVSAGETVAAAPLVRRLQQRHPATPILITVTTATGRARAEELFGAGVTVTWLPWDLPWTLRAFLRRTRPRLLVIMETELWPNLIAACARAGVPAMLVNARLSERSARGYRRILGLTRRMLRDLAGIACQDHASAERFVELGAPPARLGVTGSIKFEPDLPEDLPQRVATARARLGGDSCRLLVMASTHEDEEARILTAFAPALAAHADWRLVLVPRHPERFEAVWRLCERSGPAAARWSAGEVPATAQVVLVDAMGVLREILGAAEVAFIGGSLVPRGGHNPIEAALHGVPVVMGPHRFNFEAVAAAFRDAGALVEVADAEDLVREVGALLAVPEERRRRGEAARSVVQAGRGALAALVARIEVLMEAT